MHKKEAILKYFCEMDIEGLELVLDDSRTYEDASKKVFLVKLDEVFDQFKKEGDSELLYYKGKRTTKDWMNKGINGYCFVGNHSRNYSYFVFDETETDIKNIFGCYDLMIDDFYKSNDESIQLKEVFWINLSMYDYVGFEYSGVYRLMKQISKQAIEEISIDGTTFLTKEIYIYWFEKYKDFGLILMGVDKEYNGIFPFFDLYIDLRYINGYVKGEEESEIALKEFATINPEDEKELLEWLLKYEELSMDLIAVRIACFDDLDEIQSGYYLLSEELDIYVLSDDFINAVNFMKLFIKYYLPQHDKYLTICEAELIEQDCEEYYDFMYLKNILKKRGMLDIDGHVRVDSLM